MIDPPELTSDLVTRTRTRVVVKGRVASRVTFRVRAVCVLNDVANSQIAEQQQLNIDFGKS
eukprot:2572412-Amphidinium_carterae.1